MGRKRWENGKEIRIGRNYSQEKKVIWEGRKVENFGGNARLVYRARFAGRSS